MVSYNRKKRNAFYADQIRTQQELVMAAIAAEKAGLPMTEEQALMLNREKARFQAEEERGRRPGLWGRVVGAVGGRFGAGEGEGVERVVEGVQRLVEEVEEKVGGFAESAERRGGEMVDAVLHTEKEAEMKLHETVRGNLSGGGQEAEHAVLGGIEQARREAEGGERGVGGELDQRAEKMAEAGGKKLEGWGGWFGR